MIYTVVDNGYEHTETIILEGPKVKDFKKYCDSLLEEAFESDKDCNSFSKLFILLVKILEQKGYKTVRIESAKYFTDCGRCTFSADLAFSLKQLQLEGVSKVLANKLV